MPNRRTFRASALCLAIGLVWAGSVAYGIKSLAAYENAPGEPGQAPPSWPRGTAIRRAAGEFTLVMLAHPDCPCSSASMEELDTLMAQARGRVRAFVVFRKPDAPAEEVKSSSLWKRASVIPGAAALFDATGDETARFGAAVSGQVTLYDAAGRLRFSGGITGARGHAGANGALDALMREIRGDGAGGAARAPVFGCSLRNPAAGESSKWSRRP